MKYCKTLFIFSYFFFKITHNDSNYSYANEIVKKSKSPVKITSEIIEVKQKLQEINFIKNVVVEQDDSSMLADKMTVIYEKNKNSNNTNSVNQNSSIKEIRANSNVKIFSQDFIANSDYGFYDPKQNNFILEKNVVVNNGTSIANGEKFIYNLDTKKSFFVGKKKETKISPKNSQDAYQIEDNRVMVILGSDLAKDQKKQKNKQNKTENAK